MSVFSALERPNKNGGEVVGQLDERQSGRTKLPRIRSLLFAALPLVLASAVGALLAFNRNIPRPDSDREALVIPLEDLDFGDRWARASMSREVRLINHSSRTIRVTRVAPSCRCTALGFEPMPLIIPSGETRLARVTVELAQLGKGVGLGDREEWDTKEPSSWSIDVAISFKWGERPKEDQFAFRLHGRIRHLLKLDPPIVQFGTVSRHDLGRLTRTVTAIPNIPLESLAVVPGSSAVTVVVERISLGNESGYKLSVSPKKGGGVGYLDEPIELRCVASSGEWLPPVRLPVMGNIQSECRAIPDRLDCGPVSLGRPVSRRVVVRAPQGWNIEIAEASRGSDLAVTCLEESAAGTDHTYEVTAHFKQVGHREGEVRFIASNGAALEELVVPLTGYAISEDSQPEEGQ